MADGRVIDRNTVPLTSPSSDPLGRVWYFRDITERRRAEDGVAYRDRLLHAVMDGTTLLVKTDSLTDGLADALRILGESTQVDRAFVMQDLPDPARPVVLRASWEAPGVQPPLTSAALAAAPPDPVARAAWLAPLREGRAVVTQIASADPSIRMALEHFRTQSSVMVALVVGDRQWGVIGIDACKVARDWNATEIDTLTTFAKIIGTFILRDESRVALEISEARFRVLTATAQDAIITTDDTGVINQWNQAAERMLGYSAQEAVSRSANHLLAPPSRREDADPLLAAGNTAPGRTLELTVIRKDGTEIAAELSVSGAQLGSRWESIGILRDVTQRTIAASALAYRDRLLHAVTVGTGVLVKAATLDQGMPDALRILGECLQVDRLILMQEIPAKHVAGTLPGLRHFWQIPGIEGAFDASAFVLSPAESSAVAAWHAPLLANQPVITDLVTSKGPIRALFDRMHIKSSLMVPIFVDGALWGSLGVDACQAARHWTAGEIDTLKIFGDIVGSLTLRQEAQLLLRQSEARFRAVTTTAQDAIITIDRTGRIRLWNGGAERILGYGAAEAVGRRVHELLSPPQFRAKADQGMAVFQATGQGDAIGKTRQLAARRKDGTEIAIEISLASAPVGDTWEATGILRDVTERKTAEDKLQFANALLKNEMEASPFGIMVVNPTRNIILFNRRLSEIWNVPMAEIEGSTLEGAILKITPLLTDPPRFLARLNDLLDLPGVDDQVEYALTDRRILSSDNITLFGVAREYLGRVFYFRDITERKRAEALALRMARHDVLTGLANRAVFVEALQRAIVATKRGEHGFSVLYLDLDHFKDVNDTLGHPVGDQLLIAVADRLRGNTRETDTVARFGGDEFAIIVADIQDPADAAIVADKLMKAFGIPFSIQGNDIHVGASIGIATYGAEATDAETLLSHADVALYRAKSDGRGGYRFFAEAMDVEVQTRVKLGGELRLAIDAGQLFLMYQPQVAIDSARVNGLEALVRWQHPTRGILGPDIFIPIAEQIGIIAKLGHWVLWEACRQGGAWLDAGIAPIRIGVNVSALQFRTPVALEADIAAALAHTGLSPKMLELELTETVLMDASREHSDLFQRLRKTGVTIAIDDFGTGYSSLDYLRRFPSNRIKIAQNFVRHMETAPGDATIVRATIGLARELKIDVIAEGVETQAQCILLKSWGCDEVQGFYFAKPLAVADATVILRAGRIPRGDTTVTA